MKKAILIVAMTTMLYSCGSSQNKAMKDQEKALAALNATPGAVPASADGYTMKAKVDGKDWTASSMMPPELSGTIVGYNNGEYIALPYDRRDLVVGNKIIFGDHKMVRLSLNGDVAAWESKKGQMEITKVDRKWAEGTFFFTGIEDHTNKTAEVTGGHFRIPIENR